MDDSVILKDLLQGIFFAFMAAACVPGLFKPTLRPSWGWRGENENAKMSVFSQSLWCLFGVLISVGCFLTAFHHRFPDRVFAPLFHRSHCSAIHFSPA
jgi:hypothetical protein